MHVEDHPYDYASFEGVIPPKQYGAGEVIVWDCGVYSPDEDQEHLFHDNEEAQKRVREGIVKGKLSVLLRGEKVKGSFALVRISPLALADALLVICRSVCPVRASTRRRRPST